MCIVDNKRPKNVYVAGHKHKETFEALKGLPISNGYFPPERRSQCKSDITCFWLVFEYLCSLKRNPY